MRCSIVSGVVAAFLWAGSAQAGIVETFNVENWGGLAFADDATGKTVNCSVHVTDQTGARLLFIKNADESWFFSLTNDTWKLTPNAQYPVRYKIDAPSAIDAEAEALSATQLGIYMAQDDPLLDRVRRGERLSFTFEERTYTFDLDGSGLALDAAEGCLTRHGRKGTETAAAPDAVRPEPAARPPAAIVSSPEIPAQAEQGVAPASSSDPASDGRSFDLPPLGAVQIETMEVPGWEAAAFADAGSAFTHCAIRAEYENGTTLSFARTAGGSLVMALARQDWATQPGSRVLIKYRIAGRDMRVEAQAREAGLLMIAMGAEPLVTADLKSTPEIVVEAEGKTLTFDITDIGPGLEATEACLEKHGGAAKLAGSLKKPLSSKKVAPAGPAARTSTATESADATGPDTITNQGSSQSAEAPGPDAGEVKREAQEFTTSLLARSGYADHKVLTGEDVPESMRDRASAWRIGEIIGITDIVGGTVAEIRQQLEATDRKDCAGAFTHEPASEAEGSAAHVFSSCKSPGLNLEIHYVILPRPADGFFLLSFIAFAESSAVEAVATEVFETGIAG